jgi:hypothetical protein
MYMRELRQGSDAQGLATERVAMRAAVGIVSIALLLFALVSAASLRVVLVSGGLVGLLGVRLAAANAGWARRGSAWTEGHRRPPLE